MGQIQQGRELAIRQVLHEFCKEDGGRTQSGVRETERGVGLMQVGMQGVDGGQRAEIRLVTGLNSVDERWSEIDKMKTSCDGLDFPRAINLQVNSD